MKKDKQVAFFYHSSDIEKHRDFPTTNEESIHGQIVRQAENFDVRELVHKTTTVDKLGVIIRLLDADHSTSNKDARDSYWDWLAWSKISWFLFQLSVMDLPENLSRPTAPELSQGQIIKGSLAPIACLVQHKDSETKSRFEADLEKAKGYHILKEILPIGNRDFVPDDFKDWLGRIYEASISKFEKYSEHSPCTVEVHQSSSESRRIKGKTDQYIDLISLLKSRKSPFVQPAEPQTKGPGAGFLSTLRRFSFFSSIFINRKAVQNGRQILLREFARNKFGEFWRGSDLTGLPPGEESSWGRLICLCYIAKKSVNRNIKSALGLPPLKNVQRKLCIRPSQGAGNDQCLYIVPLFIPGTKSRIEPRPKSSKPSLEMSERRYEQPAVSSQNG